MPIALKDLNSDLYKQAHAQGVTLSALLERENPSKPDSKVDAFERLMMEAGILPQSNHSKNIFASTVDAFYRTNENKALFPEYIARTFIQAVTQFPLYNYLVANRFGIDGNVYSATYIDLDEASNKKAVQMKRVTEAADLPIATLKLGKSAIQFSKYGIGVSASYEAIRRMSLDLFNIHVRAIGTYAADNKVADILAVIKDGDGNNNAAPIVKTSDLDSATEASTKITRTAWIKFLLSFYPYGCDTVVANVDGLIQILEVLYPKSEVASKMDELLANGLKVSTMLPQNLIANTTLLYSPYIEKISNKEVIYGLNRGSTIEEIFELGSTISEADKFIKNQTQLLTVSENNGFRKILKDTSKILSIQ